MSVRIVLNLREKWNNYWFTLVQIKVAINLIEIFVVLFFAFLQP